MNREGLLTLYPIVTLQRDARPRHVGVATALLASIPVGALTASSRLLVIITVWPAHLSTRRTLRATTTTAAFRALPTAPKNLTTLAQRWQLRFVAGLLRTRTLGPTIRTDVTAICPPRLKSNVEIG